MDKKNTEETVETREANPAAPAPKVEIIRGRMPVAVVAMIRFKEEGAATSALAAKYRTTVGKIDDIKKGRNFGYVKDDFKPTPAQIEDAKGYLNQLDGDNVADTLGKLEAMGVAEDGGAAFEAARLAARQRNKPAEAAPAAPAETEGAEEGGDVVEESDLSEFTE